MAKCVVCEGKGALKCEICEGKGDILGTGTVCNVCEGVGIVRCENCSGKGLIPETREAQTGQQMRTSENSSNAYA